MANKPIDPIVAERDDMIGRPNSGTASTRKAGQVKDSAAGMSGGWKFLIWIALFGLAGATGFGWVEYQHLVEKHESLLQRFDALESRLSSTDESVTQSGAALQVKISRQGDDIAMHWSEIKKLWGVTNDINKGKIDKNRADVAFLSGQLTPLKASVKKDSKIIGSLGESYLGFSADLDAANENLRSYVDSLNSIQKSLASTKAQIKNNAEAVESMEAFRRQINQKIYALERGYSPASDSAVSPSN
jgi:chromosome segregation ATPase